MVVWVVIDRRHYRQADPFALPLSTPLFPLLHLSPLLPYSYGHSYTTATHQPLCNQSLTHSFYLDGGCTPCWFSPRDRDPYSVPTTHLKFFLFTFLRTLLHIFAFFCTHQKLNSLVFNRFRTLCTKHGGWGKGCNGVEFEIGKWKVERLEASRSRWEGMGRTYCRPAGTRMASFISVFAFLHESRSP